MKYCALPTLLLAASLTPVCGANLIIDPGFEAEVANPGSTPWTSFAAAGFNSFFGPDAHASLFGNEPGNFGAVFQTGISAEAGLEYTFAITNFLIQENFVGNLTIGLEFYEGDESTLLDTVSLAWQPSATAPVSVVATAPTGSVFVRPIASLSDAGGEANSQGNVFIFDTSLTAVPEPSSAFLLLGASLGLIATRRRK